MGVFYVFLHFSDSIPFRNPVFVTMLTNEKLLNADSWHKALDCLHFEVKLSISKFNLNKLPYKIKIFSFIFYSSLTPFLSHALCCLVIP